MNNYLSAGLGLVAGLGLGVGACYLAGCGSTPVRGKPYDSAAPVFPQVIGENLNGRRFEIPGDLDAAYNILLVAFYQKQQDDVNSWLEAARSISADHANVEYYELPTINSAWGMVRGWIDGGMRSGIPDFSARERTITIYTDTERFRKLAGIDSPERIWVGLVDRAGKVYWTAQGPATKENIKELRQIVRNLASPQTPLGG